MPWYQSTDVSISAVHHHLLGATFIPQHCFCVCCDELEQCDWCFVAAHVSVLFSGEGNPNVTLVSKRSSRTGGVSGVEGVQHTVLHLQPTHGTFTGSSSRPVNDITAGWQLTPSWAVSSLFFSYCLLLPLCSDTGHLISCSLPLCSHNYHPLDRKIQPRMLNC